MADTMLSFAFEKLSTLITAEAELLGSLSDDVRKLQYELDSIKEVLKDAEKKAEVDNGIRVWLTQLRESAYHIEDVIDQYFLLKQQQQQQQQHLLQSDYNKSLKNQFLLMINKISKRVKSAFACITQLKPKHELSSEMKKILADIVEINNRRERYELITTPDDSTENEQNWQDPRVSSLFKDESELFDFTHKKTQIFSWLNLDEQDDQDRTKIQGPRAVIAVVGMGGLGKTTLVRKVYEDKKVKEGFSVYAWVTVSQSYRWRDLLNSIFKQVHAEPSLQLDTSDEHTIISKLRIHLEEKRYIVVFDDVWDSKLWEYVENALPNNKRCSAIMMTTREVDVGGAWNDPSSGHHLYKLEPLSAKASWDLFCHKTFGNTNCPPELEKLSWEMVGKCEGLPLALVAIAGLLSTKEKIISEWIKLYNSFGFEMGSNPHFSNTTKILLFSYYKLPYYLKPCFLYLGMFPEDYIISSNMLVRLWIAEGFIQNQRGKTVEEVAKEYLGQLINRSLIQVHEINNPTERPQIRFRVHDIVREIVILPKLDYLCIGEVLSENNLLTTNKKIRRLSIYADGVSNIMFAEVVNNGNILSSTRSLLWFSNLSEPYMSSFLKVTRLLKVLDLGGASINNIPNELGNLHNLHYLSLRNTQVKTLPRTIGELWNLQTLDLKQCLVAELPREIGNCHKLRHLIAYVEEHVHLHLRDGLAIFWRQKLKKKGVKILERVLNFPELQKLARLDVADRPSLIVDLRHLNQLRRLEITNLQKEYGRELCSAIEKMRHLQSLSVQSKSNVDADHEILDLEYKFSPPPLLERLYLGGPLILEKLPRWIKWVRNLTKLYLAYSRLQEGELYMLHYLPNLEDLTLNEAYIGEHLHFAHGKLKVVILYGLPYLKYLYSNMPHLQTILIDGCPNKFEVSIHNMFDTWALSQSLRFENVRCPFTIWQTSSNSMIVVNSDERSVRGFRGKDIHV